MLKYFREAGFLAERIDETDFGYGVDLILYRDALLHPPDWTREALPVAIQCKCTARRSDGLLGLEQARRGWPEARLYICLHALHLRGYKSFLHIYAAYRDMPTVVYTDLNLAGIMRLIRQVCGLLKEKNAAPKKIAGQ